MAGCLFGAHQGGPPDAAARRGLGSRRPQPLEAVQGGKQNEEKPDTQSRDKCRAAPQVYWLVLVLYGNFKGQFKLNGHNNLLPSLRHQAPARPADDTLARPPAAKMALRRDQGRIAASTITTLQPRARFSRTCGIVGPKHRRAQSGRV